MHWKSDNIEIMINDKADKAIEELFPTNSFQISNWVGNITERERSHIWLSSFIVLQMPQNKF